MEFEFGKEEEKKNEKGISGDLGQISPGLSPSGPFSHRGPAPFNLARANFTDWRGPLAGHTIRARLARTATTAMWAQLVRSVFPTEFAGLPSWISRGRLDHRPALSPSYPRPGPCAPLSMGARSPRMRDPRVIFLSRTRRLQRTAESAGASPPWASLGCATTPMKSGFPPPAPPASGFLHGINRTQATNPSARGRRAGTTATPKSARGSRPLLQLHIEIHGGVSL
mgnify:CR=1 FL=1